MSLRSLGFDTMTGLWTWQSALAALVVWSQVAVSMFSVCRCEAGQACCTGHPVRVSGSIGRDSHVDRPVGGGCPACTAHQGVAWMGSSVDGGSVASERSEHHAPAGSPCCLLGSYSGLMTLPDFSPVQVELVVAFLPLVFLGLVVVPAASWVGVVGLWPRPERRRLHARLSVWRN